MMPAAADAALVDRLRRGERAAFRELYARFAQASFGFLLRLCGRRDVAEDLQQDVWLSIARHAARLNADTDLAAWIFTVARNRFVSSRRRADVAVPAGDPADLDLRARGAGAHRRSRVPRSRTAPSRRCRTSTARCCCWWAWKGWRSRRRRRCCRSDRTPRASGWRGRARRSRRRWTRQTAGTRSRSRSNDEREERHVHDDTRSPHGTVAATAAPGARRHRGGADARPRGSGVRLGPERAARAAGGRIRPGGAGAVGGALRVGRRRRARPALPRDAGEARGGCEPPRAFRVQMAVSSC